MIYIGNLLKDEQLYSANQIIVCGAGKMLNLILSALDDMKITKRIVAVCDKNSTMISVNSTRIKVISYDEALEWYPEAEYIVYNKFSKEICEMLFEKGVSSIHLVRMG